MWSCVWQKQRPHQSSSRSFSPAVQTLTSRRRQLLTPHTRQRAAETRRLSFCSSQSQVSSSSDRNMACQNNVQGYSLLAANSNGILKWCICLDIWAQTCKGPLLPFKIKERKKKDISLNFLTPKVLDSSTWCRLICWSIHFSLEKKKTRCICECVHWCIF